MKIPEDTQNFHYHNENPKGKHTTDCVIRAIAVATNTSWETTLSNLTALAMKHSQMPIDKNLYAKYLASLGWDKHAQPRKHSGKKFTAAEFAQVLKGRPAIAHVGGHHMSFLNENKVWDTWDCSGRCVGNYWIKLT